MQKKIEKKLKEIGEIILNTNLSDKQSGVLSGNAGISLFLMYYYNFFEDERHFNKGIELLETTIEEINKGNTNPTYCSGLAGYGWVLDHLVELEFLKFNNDDLFEKLDDSIYYLLKVDMQVGNYDFLHGGIGYGYYFLKRYKTTKSIILKNKYKYYLLDFIFLLEKTSIKEPNENLKWKIVFENSKGKGIYDFSLSHGISSIINFLSRLNNFDDFKKESTILLKNACNYLVSNVKKENYLVSFYSDIEESSLKTQSNSRLGWCYGDLGIGLSLLKASKSLDDKKMEIFSINILKQSTNRKNYNNTYVNDAGFCHGSFGISQIYKYLYYETEMYIFKDAADFWINDGLKKMYHEDGLAGYKKFTIDGWESDLSILEGIAGIGLTLISFLSEENTNWDECLMLS